MMKPCGFLAWLMVYVCFGSAISTADTPPPAPAAGFDVGAIAGEFRVDEAGAATYSVPLSLPRGTAGVAPQLSFQYSSQAGNGLLGQGWSLGGTSKIVRCRQTFHQDGQAKPISWSEDDRFCLDGQRLMLVSGSFYGAVGSTYRTEIDQYLVVKAIGGTDGHPDAFELEAKDGSKVQFGGTSDSRLRAGSATLLWAQSRFEDRVGNRINFEYRGDAADGFRLDAIYYAYSEPRTNTGSAAHIKFEYEDRPDPIVTYIAGRIHKTAHRLERVTIYNEIDNASQEYRRYNLAYQAEDKNSTDHLSRLESLEECVDTTCVPKTLFDWPQLQSREDGSEILWAEHKEKPLGLGREVRVIQQQPVDIDGDGKLDLVWMQYREGDTRQSLKYALADEEGGYSHPGSVNNSSFAIEPRAEGGGVTLHLLDYNGDGRQDVVTHQPRAPDGSHWRLFLSTPDRNNGWGLKYHDALNLDAISESTYVDPAFRFADLDGDGLSDAYYLMGQALRVHHLRPSGEPISSNVYYSFESEFTEYALTGLPGAEGDNYRSIQSIMKGGLGDFTGDGRADLVVRATEYRRVWIEWGSYMASYPERTDYMVFTRSDSGFEYYATIGDEAESVRIADINADGLADVVYKQEDVWKFQLNSGAELLSSKEVSGTSNDVALENIFLVDLNRDSHLDFVWRTSSKIFYFLWDASASSFSEHRLTFSDSYLPLDKKQIALADVTGDGWIDVLKFDSTFSVWRIIRPSQKDRLSPNVLTAVTDGLGNRTKIDYQLLTASDHYSRLDPGEWRTVHLEEVCVEMGGGFSDPGRSERCHTPIQHSIDTSEFYESLNQPFSSLPEDNDHLDSAGSPVLEIHAPLPVVTQVTRSRPSGADRDAQAKTSYYYDQMKFQAAGRGSLGFRKLTSVDHQAGTVTETTYRQDWPFLGSPLATTVKSMDGSILNQAINTWGLKSYTGPDASRRYQPYVKKAVEENYNLVGNGRDQGERLTRSTTTTDYDDDGNPTLMEVVTEGPGQTQTKVVENNYGDAWHQRFGRLRSTTVTTTRGSDTDTRTSTFDYVTSGHKRGMLKTETIMPESDYALATTYHYDDYGNIIRTEKNAADGTASTSDTTLFEKGRYVLSVSNALGHTVREILARNRFGDPSEIRDINGLLTTLSYDALGREYLRQDATGAWSWQSRRECDGAIDCPEMAVYRQENKTAGGGTSYTYYDLLLRPIRETTIGFDGQSVHTDTEYDPLGQVHRVSTPYREGDEPAGWTQHTYDLLGRNTSVTLPDGRSGGTVAYDGFETTTTDALGRSKVEKKDLGGQLAEVTDHLGGTVNYEYDLSGNLLSATTEAPGAVTVTVRMCYDPLGRKVAMHDPDKGGFLGNEDATCQDVVEKSNLAGWWYYEHNGIGQLVGQTDTKRQRRVMTYDPLGRMLTRTDRRADNSVEGHTRWYYDADMEGKAAPGDLGNLTYVVHSYNRISAACGGDNHCTTYVYDELGRATDTITHLPGVEVPYQTGVAYDDIGRAFRHYDVLHGLVMSDSGTEHHYNDYGYKYRVTDLASGDTLQHIRQMSVWGQVAEERRGNGTDTFYKYDPHFGRLKKQQAMVGAIFPVQNIAYQWDVLGNLKSRHNQSTRQGNTQLKDLQESFCYDGLNRLIKSHLGTLDGSCALSGVDQDVEYDGLGNITRKKGVGQYHYGVDAGPHAVTRAGDTRYTYDDNGNMIGGDGRTLQYSTFDQLLSVSKGTASTRFRYRADRSRYQRTDVSGNRTTVTQYLGNVERIHVEGSNTVTWRRSVAGALYTVTTDLDHQVQGNTDKVFVYRDHLGSTDVLTDKRGTVLQSQSFDAWGQRRASEDWRALSSGQLVTFDTGLTRRGYTDHEHLDSMGLIHMNGRVYDPKLARFIQADPIIQAAGNTQSYNRYSYVWNNPLNATDPSGYFLSSLWKEIRPFVGAIVAVGLTIMCHPCGLVAMTAIGGVAGAVGAAANGSNILRGAALGAFSGWAAGGGGWMGAAVAGGFSAAALGGDARGGFAAAGIGAYMGGVQGDWSFVAAAVGGGLASEVTGGKFKNGAATGAFMWALSAGARSVANSKGSNSFAEQGESEFYTIDENGNKTQTLEQRRRELRHFGVREGRLSRSERVEISAILDTDEFKAAESLVVDTALECRCEPTALRVTEIEGVYFIDKVGSGTSGLRIESIPKPLEFKNWRHVFDWHPHPSGTPLSSVQDLLTSQSQGTNNVIWYGNGTHTIYRGERR